MSMWDRYLNGLSDALQKFLPSLTVSGLGVPSVKVLTDLAQERRPNRLATERQNAACQIEEVENVKVLTSGECAGHTTLQFRLVLRSNSWRGKEDVFDLPLSGF